jgi:hypothetical protein
MAEAAYFGLSAEEAKQTAGVVGAAVSGWRKEAGALGLNKAAIDRRPRHSSTAIGNRRFAATRFCSN